MLRASLIYYMCICVILFSQQVLSQEFNKKGKEDENLEIVEAEKKHRNKIGEVIEHLNLNVSTNKYEFYIGEDIHIYIEYKNTMETPVTLTTPKTNGFQVVLKKDLWNQEKILEFFPGVRHVDNLLMKTPVKLIHLDGYEKATFVVDISSLFYMNYKVRDSEPKEYFGKYDVWLEILFSSRFYPHPNISNKLKIKIQKSPIGIKHLIDKLKNDRWTRWAPNTLKKLTGMDFDYRYFYPDEKRMQHVQKWEDWYETNKDKLIWSDEKNMFITQPSE